MANSRYKNVKEKAQRERAHISHKNISVSLLIVLVVLVTVFIIGISTMSNQLNYKLENEYKKISAGIPSFVSIDGATFVSLKVPAVDASGKGTSTYLAVEAMPGSGRTLVDIDNLLFWDDTQQSMRVARLVAANVSGKNINNYDLVYNVYANASIVGGPSAGAALTVATIASLESKKINDSVMITGTVNHDGTIGPVGGILEKAKAAKQAGATLLLVPLLQSRDVLYETREHCEKFGPAQVCTTETIPKKVDVSSEAGLQIIEVGTIKEALEYIFE